ncbi:MAG: alpha/beta fold hydrolase [Bdellovibrionota bacterium]
MTLFNGVAVTESIKNNDNIRVQKHLLHQKPFTVGAFSLLPSIATSARPAMAIFTHGYTSHKGSILTWPIRLAQEGIPSLIFDLPGHYLGSFNEVEKFSDFKRLTHQLFIQAFYALKANFCQAFPEQQLELNRPDFTLVLGGHSLGALLALKALALPELEAYHTIAIAVGFGISKIHHGNHIFETPFYKSTLHVRSQLVSTALNPTKVFAWIREEKKNIGTHLKPSRVHMIVGQDDLIVQKEGAEHIRDLLLAKGHNVSLEYPTRLPHHLPEEAASYIKRFLVSEKIIN